MKNIIFGYFSQLGLLSLKFLGQSLRQTEWGKKTGVRKGSTSH